MELPNTDKEHSVPTGYFKIITTKGGKLSAFIFDQDDTRETKPYCTAIVSLEEVRNKSGLDIFPSKDNWPKNSLDNVLGC